MNKSSSMSMTSIFNKIMKQPAVLDDFGWKDESNPYVKKHETFELKEDLITLAVAWKRFRKERNERNTSTYGITVNSMLDVALFEFVNDDDRKLASEIKDYYSKKFMMLKLQGIHFSKYRDDLNSYIHSQTNIVTTEQLPMVYYLPDFYEYDKTFDMLYTVHNKEVTQPHVNNTITLTFVKKFSISRKRTRKIECWFVDENRNLFNFNTDYNNQLVPLLEQATKDGLKVVCSAYKRKRDTNEYLEITSLKFV